MKFWKYIEEHFEGDIMTVLLAIIAIVMMLQVIMRYVFNNALPWAEELSRYLYIWFVFLSAGYCTRKNSDLRVEIVIDMFPRPVKYMILILGQVVITFFYAFIGYHSIAVVTNLYQTQRLSAALQVPMYLIYAASLVGFIIGTLRCIQRICVLIKEMRTPAAPAAAEAEN